MSSNFTLKVKQKKQNIKLMLLHLKAYALGFSPPKMFWSMSSLFKTLIITTRSIYEAGMSNYHITFARNQANNLHADNYCIN